VENNTPLAQIVIHGGDEDMGDNERKRLAERAYASSNGAEMEAKHVMSRIEKILIDELDREMRSRVDPAYDILSVKIRASLKALGIKSQGRTSSLLNNIGYGAPMRRLTSKIEAARSDSESLRDWLDSYGPIDFEEKDKVLLQAFVLERFSIIKRYALENFLFDFDRMAPEEVDLLPWLGAWAAILLSMTFFIYWIFAWCVSNGGKTLNAWAINFAFAFGQEVLFVLPVKILIMGFVAVEMTKPQLKAIYRTISDIAITLTDRKLAREARMEDDVDVRVIQHTSAACRVSELEHLRRQPAAMILRQLDDVDGERCRRGNTFNIGRVLFLLFAIPVTLAIVNEFAADFIVETVLASLFSSILLFLHFLMTTGLIYFFVPFVVISIAASFYFAKRTYNRRQYKISPVADDIDMNLGMGKDLYRPSRRRQARNATPNYSACIFGCFSSRKFMKLHAKAEKWKSMNNPDMMASGADTNDNLLTPSGKRLELEIQREGFALPEQLLHFYEGVLPQEILKMCPVIERTYENAAGAASDANALRILNGGAHNIIHRRIGHIARPDFWAYYDANASKDVSERKKEKDEEIPADLEDEPKPTGPISERLQVLKALRQRHNASKSPRSAARGVADLQVEDLTSDDETNYSLSPRDSYAIDVTTGARSSALFRARKRQERHW
jgi:hypothetical protein